MVILVLKIANVRPLVGQKEPYNPTREVLKIYLKSSQKHLYNFLVIHSLFTGHFS